MTVAVLPTPVSTASPAPAPSRRPWWPTRRAPGKVRFVGLDAARGLAVSGMVIAHTASIGPLGESADAWLGFAHGRSSILFATIAGVSLTLLSGGRVPPSGG